MIWRRRWRACRTLRTCFRCIRKRLLEFGTTSARSGKPRDGLRRRIAWQTTLLSALRGLKTWFPWLQTGRAWLAWNGLIQFMWEGIGFRRWSHARAGLIFLVNPESRRFVFRQNRLSRHSRTLLL